MGSRTPRQPLVTLLLTAVVVLGAVAPLVGFVGVGAAANTISGCGTISSSGTYTLTADVADSGLTYCIDVTANDVLLRGNGHTLDGTGSGYGVWVDNSSGTATNVTVENLVLTDWGDAVHFKDVEGSTIRNVEARRNTNGIYLDLSSSNTIDGVTATGNENGLYLYDSSSNTVTASTFSDNTRYGVEQAYSGTNTFTDLVVNDNAKGFILSDSHRIEDSTIRNNSEWGVWVGGVNNVLTGNNVTESGQYGLVVDANAGDNYPNAIYDNLLNNTNNTNVASSLIAFTSYPNDWNTTKAAGTNVIGGSTVGGNYWATPDGTGFSQTCTDGDGDGICDSTYALNSTNVDYHPLAMAAPNSPPSATFSYTPSSPTTDDTVGFTGQATDPDGTVASYEWDFDGDGETDKTGATASHSFASAGDHLVTLTVTDDGGATDTAQQLVSVALGSGGGGVQTPTGTLTVSQDQPEHVQPGDTVTVDLYATEVDALTVYRDMELGTNPSGLDLTVDGQSLGWGTTKTYSTPKNGTIALEVATSASLVDSFSLVVEDDAGNVLATTSPTSVHPDPISVPSDLASIQDAVDVAAPGSTIEVDDGTYVEDVVVSKNLTLTAATGASPVVSYGTGVTDFYLVTANQGSNVTVSGFTVDGGGETGGLGAYTGATLTARDVTVMRSDNRAGVAANGATVIGEDLTVQNTENMGVIAENGGELDFDGLTVDNTTGSGIVVKQDASATVRYATIMDTGLAGVTVQQYANATIDSVTVSAPGAHGVYVHTGGNATVENSAVNNPAENGVHVSGAAASAVVQGSSTTGAQNGVRVEDGATATVDGSTVTNSGYYGLIASDGADATFADNDVTGAGNAGIRFWNATGISSGNAVYGTPGMGSGLAATNGANATFEDDVVYGNQDAFRGLEVDSATATVRDLTVVETTYSGVTLVVGADATIQGANVTGIGGPGLKVHDSSLAASDVHTADTLRGVDAANATVSLTESVLADTASAGVWFDDVDGFVINTTIAGVDDLGYSDLGDGIRAEADSFVTVANATIAGVANRGVFVNSSSHATVLASNVTAWNEGVAFEHYAGGSVQRSTLDAETGVYASGGASVTVDGNTITADGASGAGVRLIGTDATIADNSIADARWGVYAFDGTVEITNNTVTNASELGVRFNVGTATLRGNSVEGGDLGGLLLESASVVVADNVVVAPGEQGIMLRDGSLGEVQENVVHAAVGVDLDSSTEITETTVRFNGLSNTTVAIDNGNTTAPGPLHATGNWFGPRGPVDTSIEGDVTYEPFLTAPPGQVDRNDTQQFGFDFEMPAGQVYAFGTPAPTEDSLDEMFGGFQGAIYLYDGNTQSWSLATGSERLDAMDAVAVVPTTDAHAVLDFVDATPPRPADRQLSEGWHLVAPRAYDALEAAFSTATVGISDVSQSMAEPQGQPAQPGDYFAHYSPPAGDVVSSGPRVSPFTGYFVYVDDAGTIPGRVLAGERMGYVRAHLQILELSGGVPK